MAAWPESMVSMRALGCCVLAHGARLLRCACREEYDQLSRSMPAAGQYETWASVSAGGTCNWRQRRVQALSGAGPGCRTCSLF